MAQTKGTKKMEKAVVVEGEKEVGFGELELKIQKPALNADKTLSISGNFEELGNKIQKVVDKYKNEVLTEENVGYIKNLKSQFVSLRTGIERERREYKKVYLDPATKLINAMCDELQKIVAEGENALGAQLDAYDQRRKDELTIILNEYKDEAAAKHNLRDEYKDQIQLIDKYYNKTQNEEDSADDIERQAVELEKKQKEEASLRKNQVGTGDRSEKIRTYNFPQGRCTDHRIKLTLHRLDAIMNGDLDEIIDSLIAADQAAKLSNMEDA